MAEFSRYCEQSIDHVELGLKIERGVIEKGIPIPESVRRNTIYRDIRQIVDTWEVGDSVAYEYFRKTTGKDRRASYSLEASSLKRIALKAGQKVKMRTLSDEGVIRIWRVE